MDVELVIVLIAIPFILLKCNSSITLVLLISMGFIFSLKQINQRLDAMDNEIQKIKKIIIDVDDTTDEEPKSSKKKS